MITMQDRMSMRDPARAIWVFYLLENALIEG